MIQDRRKDNQPRPKLKQDWDDADLPDMRAGVAEIRKQLEATEHFGISMTSLRTADARHAVNYIAHLESAATPAAGQEGLAKLVTYEPLIEDALGGVEVAVMSDSEDGGYYKVEDVEALFATLAAPVAAVTEQATIDLNGGMHASIFVKVWGDAGGGDAGRIALANYAYALGKRDAAPLATPADAGAGEALTPERIIELRDEAGKRYNSAAHVSDSGAIEFARAIEAEVLARLSTPGAPVTAPKIDTPEFHDLLDRYMRRPSNDTAGDIVAHVQKRFDAYAKGVVTATGYLRTELDKARAAVGSPAPVTAEPVATAVTRQELEMAINERLQACQDKMMQCPPLGVNARLIESRNQLEAMLNRLYATPAPADRDAIRDQALSGLKAAIANMGCNEMHAGSPNEEVRRAYGRGYRRAKEDAAELVRAADAKGDAA